MYQKYMILFLPTYPFYLFNIKWDLFFLYYRDCWHKIYQNLIFNKVQIVLLLYFFFFYLAGATFWFLSNILHCWSFTRGHFFSATVRVLFSLKDHWHGKLLSYRLPNLMIGTSKDKFILFSLLFWVSLGSFPIFTHLYAV